jgi:DNA (cytosine-5)-methyltransferase 1
MRHGSLFSGIGGFDYAAQLMGWENVFHCEIDNWSREKINTKWPKAISFGDITEVDFTPYNGQIDVLTGGFPCQDISTAKQDTKPLGINGKRSGLIHHMLRAIAEVRPVWVVAENVSNLLKINNGRDFGIILNELAGMGYNAEWRVLYASDVGAPHKRARCYLVAYPNSIRTKPGESILSNVREEIRPKPRRFIGTTIQAWGAWDNEPPAISVDDGVSRGLVRRKLKAYGNAIVPQVALQIFKTIEQYEELHLRQAPSQ